jgi:hypothetical protein
MYLVESPFCKERGRLVYVSINSQRLGCQKPRRLTAPQLSRALNNCAQKTERRF